MIGKDILVPAHAIYWGARMLGLAVPRLAVGDAVEIETYRKGFQIAYLGADDAAIGATRDAQLIGLITAVVGGRPGMISGATGAMAVVVVSAGSGRVQRSRATAGTPNWK